MVLRSLRRLPVGLLALIAAPAFAALPYNPTRILVSENGSSVYLFTPKESSSQFQLSLLNISGTIDTSNLSLSTLSPTLPFLTASSEDTFIPLLNEEGDIKALSGQCSNDASGPEIWRFVTDEDKNNGTWSKLPLSSDGSSLKANFLSAGLSFSSTTSSDNAIYYVFGGMCPNSTSASSMTTSDWTDDANYSNNMLMISSESSSSSSSSSSNTAYDLSISPARGPPVAEAGLTITPLVPTSSNTSSGSVSQQQNFILLGGHTQNAFINMSQVALFSLPESSWSFLGIDQGSSSVDIEPRSGHTALLTPDGTKIVVFGGWVGNVATAANPQLMVLELGEGFGGSGDWSWSVPSQVSNPLTTGQGIYGHGAAMLPGGVLLISGGYSISGSSSSANKRQSTSAQHMNTQSFLFNVTSASWISSYTNPSSPNSPAYIGTASSAESSGALSSSSQKAGLGAGLALGLTALVGILVIWFFYSRRLKQKRAFREKELRDLALGAERFKSSSIVGGGYAYPEVRSASWGSRQERMIGTALAHDDDEPHWSPAGYRGHVTESGITGEDSRDSGRTRHAERTGLLIEVPSPNRGLRKSLHSRGPTGYGAGIGRSPSVNSGQIGGIHRIDEAEEESSQAGSLKRKAVVNDVTAPRSEDRSADHRLSDPFKDPELQPRGPSPSTEAKRRREREVQGWVDDWSVAAAAMDRGDLSRNTSKAESNWRTISNLSEDRYSHVGVSNPGRGSPDKSDRTGSNLSEASHYSAVSIQRSVFGIGSLTRNASQRSASAGYALFTGAASAMASRMTGGSTSAGGGRTESENDRFEVTRPTSRRSASLNMNSNSSTIRSGQTRDRSDTFTTARTSIAPLHSAEDEALLNRIKVKTTYGGLGEQDHWATPPESPVKERHYPPAMRVRDGSLGHTARGILGSVKRVFTGTGNVGVQNRVAEFENRSEQNSPDKDEPEMTEIGDGVHGPVGSASTSAPFLRAQRGARDWDEDAVSPVPVRKMNSPMIVKRKPLPGQSKAIEVREDDDVEDDDWDVEAAVERRVVQVMFTVPREKLRVVNADALSLMSKSDVDFEGGENDGENKRVSIVREEAEEEREGKGKEFMR